MQQSFGRLPGRFPGIGRHVIERGDVSRFGQRDHVLYPDFAHEGKPWQLPDGCGVFVRPLVEHLLHAPQMARAWRDRQEGAAWAEDPRKFRGAHGGEQVEHQIDRLIGERQVE